MLTLRREEFLLLAFLDLSIVCAIPVTYALNRKDKIDESRMRNRITRNAERKTRITQNNHRGGLP